MHVRGRELERVLQAVARVPPAAPVRRQRRGRRAHGPARVPRDGVVAFVANRARLFFIVRGPGRRRLSASPAGVIDARPPAVWPARGGVRGVLHRAFLLAAAVEVPLRSGEILRLRTDLL